MTRLTRTCLLDLPVIPAHRDGATGTEEIQDAYLAERGAISSAAGVRTFVRRWRPLFLLRSGKGGWPGQFLDDDVKALVSLSFDAKKVFAALQRVSDDKFDFSRRPNRIAAHIALPAQLMRAFQLAAHYDVGHDLAMVRLFLDTYPQHEKALRF